MHSKQKTVTRLGKRIAGAASVVSLVGIAGAVGVGCLSRPVVAGAPSTKTNFTAEVRQQAVDKVDILLAIDNSSSMGDKQELLRRAVPDLVSRLVTPNCVDQNGTVTGKTSDGTCPNGGQAEFPPVHDMHVGIVSSSLGGRGSSSCKPTKTNPSNPALNAHQDDQGHLLNRAGANEDPVNDAKTSNFLAWFPNDPKNTGHAAPSNVPPITDVGAFEKDFQDLVSGVHEYGCGFEAQLESWYRFLIQPDPYGQIVVNGGRANLDGYDNTILQQRHDFLRPDSLVAIIMLTDENDSTVDPLSVGGQGWVYEEQAFPSSPTGGAPKGTAACDSDPNSDQCTSCAFAPNDPGCQTASKGYLDPATTDRANARFFHMKQRFGIDPQFPVERYVNGLKQRTVPDRNGEHPPDANGTPSANYVGNPNCSNPLYSRDLPVDSSNPDALCKLTAGPRTPDLVYFGVIGGVPWQLLTTNPQDPTAPFKTSFKDEDWTKLIGKDPLKYDFTGADTHMLESLTPRPGLPTTGSDTADPFSGREWDTKLNDLQYACTFDLPQEKTCPPDNNIACDCTPGRESSPPLCSNSDTGAVQNRGKAYPTIREFAVLRKMGEQGIVASLCPREPKDENSPDYGYRPAVRTIIDRLKNALSNQCLPQKLVANDQGEVPCLVLLTLFDQPADETRCANEPGLKKPDDQVLAKFREQAETEFKANGGAGQDPKDYAVCQLDQLVVPPGQSCAGSGDPGWCYVTGAGAGTCSQAILFTSGGSKVGAKISLQCIEANSNGDTGKADGG